MTRSPPGDWPPPVKLDENLASEVLVRGLRAAGIDIDTVVDEDLQGSRDEEVLASALDEGRVLITLDRGLVDVRRRLPPDQPGIVVLRLRVDDPGLQLTRLLAVLAAPRALAGRCLIVSEDGVRERELWR